MLSILQFFVGSILLLTSLSAQALPITSYMRSPFTAAQQLPGQQAFRFDGIIALSNCSGSFVRFASSQKTDKALILTNGHCVGGLTSQQRFLRPGEVMYQLPRKFTITFLDRYARPLGQTQSTKVIYATMTGTDVALLELGLTNEQVTEKTGVPPLLLAPRRPQMGTPIDVASGYWKRTYSCSIEAEVPILREGDWIFNQSLRYSRPGCEVIGGTSGSPVISRVSGEVIAINNTVNEGGKPCTINNPCESTPQGQARAYPGTGYAQQTFILYSCFVPGPQRIDLNRQGCLLARPQLRQSYL